MGSFPCTPVLVGAELFAGVGKTMFGYTENFRRAKTLLITVCILLAIELGANVAVGVITIRRFWKCGSLTRASFITALLADALLWLWEARYTILIVTSTAKYQSDNAFAILRDGLCLMLQSWIAPMIIATPVGVAMLRSFLKQPLDECSTSPLVDSIVVLSYGSLLLIPTSFFPPFPPIDNEHEPLITCTDGIFQFSMYILWYTYLLLPVGLGIWASVAPERQVLVHGLLVIVPPFITSLGIYLKETLRRPYPYCQNYQEGGSSAFVL